jgi:hypothetical protein
MREMFAQAPLEVNNKLLFNELRNAIENALGLYSDEFLHTLKRFGLRIRQFEEILHERVFEQLPGAPSERPCETMFAELSAADQGLIREFYLTRIEEVPTELRAKFAKLYRYE